jgi:hypothetical protein
MFAWVAPFSVRNHVIGVAMSGRKMTVAMAPKIGCPPYTLLMPSLKSLLAQLSPILGMSPGAIYERQRALVRLRALHAAPGKGPGSGVELSSQNLATLPIGCAAFMSLSNIDNRIFEYIQARSSGKGCVMTGIKTFGGAIEGMLEEKFAKNLPYPRDMHICFNLQAPGGYICWLESDPRRLISWFGQARAWAATGNRFSCRRLAQNSLSPKGAPYHGRRALFVEHIVVAEQIGRSGTD